MRDLSLHLLDIIRNSVSAGAAKVTVTVLSDIDKGKLHIIIRDDGAGMDEEMLKRADDPFMTTRTTRRVGMGIPLFKAAALRAAGDLEIKSARGQGTTLKGTFDIAHIDRPPLGDLPETMANVIMSDPEIEFELVLDNCKERFVFNSFSIREQLGGVKLNEFEVLEWIKGYVGEGVKAILGGVLDEIDS